MKFAKLMMASVAAAGTLFVLTGCGNSSFSVQDGEAFIRRVFFEKNEEIADALHESWTCKENVELISITPLFPDNKNPTVRWYEIVYRTKHRAYKPGYNFCDSGHGEHKSDSFQVEKNQQTKKLCLTCCTVGHGMPKFYLE